MLRPASKLVKALSSIFAEGQMLGDELDHTQKCYILRAVLLTTPDHLNNGSIKGPIIAWH